MAGKPHAIGRVEGPVSARVSKVNLVDEETHRERPTAAEKVIFVADMHVSHIQLDALKEICEERHPDRLRELLLCLIAF